MNRYIIISLSFVLISIVCYSQDPLFTFYPKDGSNKIDSIKAINLITGQVVSVKGTNKISFSSTAINKLMTTEKVLIYPNPSSGETELKFLSEFSEEIKITLINNAGQIVKQQNLFLERGLHNIKVSTNKSGVYLVYFRGENQLFTIKIITVGGNNKISSVEYLGMDTKRTEKRSVEVNNPDIVHFYIYAGNRTTKIADSLLVSKSYDVEFLTCMDDDGNNYPIVQIGEQWWMAENLAYLPKVYTPLSENKSYTNPVYYVYNYEGTNVDEAKLRDNYKKYGVIYNWVAAKKSCPDNWHLPNAGEWDQLAKFISDQKGPYYVFLSDWRGVGKHLKSTSWQDGLDEFGFSALGTGYVGPWFAGGGTVFWEENNSAYSKSAGSRWLRSYSNDFDRSELGKSYYGFYVRCVKNDTGYISVPNVYTTEISDTMATSVISGGEILNDGGAEIIEKGICWSKFDYATIFDNKVIDSTSFGKYSIKIEGLKPNTTYYARAFATNSKGTGYGDQYSFNTKDTLIIQSGQFTDWRDSTEYNWKRIGDQIWMAENLSYLPEVSPPDSGSNTKSFYYVYDYNGTDLVEAKSAENYETYGALYNWSAAIKACPNGWHLPSHDEWEQLVDFLGGFSKAGGKMKEEGSSHWGNPNVGATNESGFTGLPGGYRSHDGEFMSLSRLAYFYSSTENGIEKASGRYLYFYNDKINLLNHDKNYAFSVRCIQD